MSEGRGQRASLKNCRESSKTRNTTFSCIRGTMSTSGEEHGLDLAAVEAQSKEEQAREESVVHGSAAWFAEVVGLPNWGLDPRKDVNHVSNKDLLILFQDKVSHKGYAWEQCKSEAVKRRIEQMYPPLFQVASMPKDGYICESFARAVVSEVLMFSSMNWALLGEEKWRGKSGHREVVCYKESGEEKTYKAAVLKRIATDFNAIESELNNLELERKLASDRVEDIRSSPEAIASAQKSRTLEDEMKKMKSKVSIEELDEHHSRLMLKYYVEDDPNDEKVAKYTLKLANNECKLAQLKEQISKLDSLHRESNSKLLNALDVVGNLNREIKDCKEARKIKMKVIQTLTNPLRRPTSLHLSTIIGDIPNGD